MAKWEYCEIERGIEDDNSFFGSLLSRSKFWLTVQAIGPIGRYVILETPRTNYAIGMNPEKDRVLIDQVVGRLLAEGWEVLPDRGQWPWSHKFRRMVR